MATTNRPRSDRRRAFTLIELVVVMAILAIVAVMVIPYASDGASYEAMAAARRLVADLEYAQSMSITEQSPVTVTFLEGDERYTLTNASGTLKHPIDKDDYVVDFDDGQDFGQVDLYSASFGTQKAVTFDELGAPSQAGTILLQAGPHLYTIKVAAATGAITIE